MYIQKNYIELLLKKIPKRIFSIEERNKFSNDDNKSNGDNFLPKDNFENKNEWTQEYEVIYNSYVLEK